jgi:hypothetical protein
MYMLVRGSVLSEVVTVMGRFPVQYFGFDMYSYPGVRLNIIHMKKICEGKS